MSTRMNGKYLITTDNFFFGKDGKQYRAVWGDVEVLQDDVLGVKTNRNSTNWYLKVGNENNHVIIAGCQIHYANKCNDRPNTGLAQDFSTSTGELKEFLIPTQIYIAE